MAKKQKAEKSEPAKAKQSELPGVEKEKIQIIEDAASDYVRVRDKRMALTEEEVENKRILLQAMNDNKLDRYRTEDDQLVRILPGKTNIKVESAGGSSVDVAD